MKTAVSLFTGCGGSDAGLVSCGFEVLLANDILPYAREVYLANLPETNYLVQDVSSLTVLPQADLLVGCYPCQGFSVGGLRQPSNHINYLYREFDRVLRKLKPKAFVVENVSGMKRSNLAHLFNNQLSRFRSAGYRVSHSLLDARDFGIPQERSRLFFVGIRSDIELRYQFPSPTHSWKRDGMSDLPLCPNIQDAIGDLPLWPSGEYDEQSLHWYYLSRNRYRGWEEYSRTIVANSRHVPLHPVSPKLLRRSTDEWYFATKEPARRLSYREASRLQGFPREFLFPDTAGMKTKYRVVGNAVPPRLFEVVVNAFPNVW